MGCDQWTVGDGSRLVPGGSLEFLVTIRSPRASGAEAIFEGGSRFQELRLRRWGLPESAVCCGIVAVVA